MPIIIIIYINKLIILTPKMKIISKHINRKAGIFAVILNNSDIGIGLIGIGVAN